MRRNWMIGALVLMVTALAAGDVLAKGRGRGGPGRGQGALGGTGPGAGLDLTAEQQQRLAKLRAEHSAQMAETRAALQVKRTELRALWLADSPDRQAILAKQAEMEPLRAKLRQARVDHRLVVHTLLTPEQRVRWADRPGRGRGMGPGCGQGGRGRGLGSGGW